MVMNKGPGRPKLPESKRRVRLNMLSVSPLTARLIRDKATELHTHNGKALDIIVMSAKLISAEA